MMHNFLNPRDAILVFSVLSDPEFFSLKITSAMSPPVSFHAFFVPSSLSSIFIGPFLGSKDDSAKIQHV